MRIPATVYLDLIDLHQDVDSILFTVYAYRLVHKGRFPSVLVKIQGDRLQTVERKGVAIVSAYWHLCKEKIDVIILT